MPEPAVFIEHVFHRYGTREALRDVTFSIASGTLFGLLGPNGGGKTTLFRIISTLLRPSSGLARVFGYDTRSDAAAVRRSLGIVFQQDALDDELTVAENLRIHGALYGLHGADLERRIAARLADLDLADRAASRVRTLSGGLRRRADLARGLLHDPPVLLLDEPTTGLDPAARSAFWSALARLRRREGTTLLVATHLLEEAETCDEIGILDGGRLVVQGRPDDLKARVGQETLWLESSDPARLSEAISARFGLETRVVGRSVQVAHGQAHSLLPALYEAFQDDITSATLRRPTLEDVFLLHTGAQLAGPVTAPGTIVA